MTKFKGKVNKLSREDLANPFYNMSYKERLIKSKATDLRDNCIVIDLGNGYSKIEPIDKDKVVK